MGSGALRETCTEYRAMSPIRNPVYEFRFVASQCSYVPPGQIIVFRWPSNLYNVLGYTRPTHDQALAAISSFIEAEAEKQGLQGAPR